MHGFLYSFSQSLKNLVCHNHMGWDGVYNFVNIAAGNSSYEDAYQCRGCNILGDSRSHRR